MASQRRKRRRAQKLRQEQRQAKMQSKRLNKLGEALVQPILDVLNRSALKSLGWSDELIDAAMASFVPISEVVGLFPPNQSFIGSTIDLSSPDPTRVDSVSIPGKWFQ